MNGPSSVAVLDGNPERRRELLATAAERDVTVIGIDLVPWLVGELAAVADDHPLFDALIIDVYLPVVDGPKVILTARSELGLVDLPIIAVSAGGDQARDAALAAGANIFLEKPMRLRRVIETMQRLLTPARA